jgi:hypothetical protein
LGANKNPPLAFKIGEKSQTKRGKLERPTKKFGAIVRNRKNKSINNGEKLNNEEEKRVTFLQYSFSFPTSKTICI